MEGICGKQTKIRNAYKILGGNLKRQEHLGDFNYL
jgi:hypothetical protein